MVSDVEGYPVTTVAGLEANTLADGLFHVATWFLVLARSVTTISAWQQGRLAPSWRFHFGLGGDALGRLAGRGRDLGPRARRRRDRGGGAGGAAGGGARGRRARGRPRPLDRHRARLPGRGGRAAPPPPAGLAPGPGRGPAGMEGPAHRGRDHRAA